MNHDAESDDTAQHDGQVDSAPEHEPELLAADSVVVESPVVDAPVVTHLVDDGPIIEGPTVITPEEVGEIEEIDELDQLEEAEESAPTELVVGETPILDDVTTIDPSADDDGGFEDEQIASLVEQLEADEEAGSTAAPAPEAAIQPEDDAAAETETETETQAAETPASADNTETKESRLSRAEARVAARKEAMGASVPLWPFVVYDVVWLAFAGIVIWQLLDIPAGEAAYDATIYPALLIAGIALTVVGPLLIVAVWFFSRREDADSSHLFVSALVRGAVATSIGVALWWAALLVIDQMRFGTLF